MDEVVEEIYGKIDEVRRGGGNLIKIGDWNARVGK